MNSVSVSSSWENESIVNEPASGRSDGGGMVLGRVRHVLADALLARAAEMDDASSRA